MGHYLMRLSHMLVHLYWLLPSSGWRIISHPRLTNGLTRRSSTSSRMQTPLGMKSTGSPESDLESKFWGFNQQTVEFVQLQDSKDFASKFDEWFWGIDSGGVNEAIFKNDQRGVILFDGLCNFCDGSVNFFIDHDQREDGTFRFAAQQSSIGRILLQQQSGKDPEDLKSIVLITPNGLYCKSDAVLEIARSLRDPYCSLASIVRWFPQPVRDQVYDFVSENRKVFGEKNSCRIPDEGEVRRFLE